MLGQLGEVIVYVEDMAAQVAFYRDVLGLSVIVPEGAFDAAAVYWVLFDTGDCKLALHGGGRRRFGEDAPKFVFFVDDIQAARKKLLAAGVPTGEIRSPAPGIEVADSKDPEGNAFSIEMHEAE
jgi:catechol 2,3-dioxygenase-like lactoylglutathione lyase family enzyme